MPESQLDYAATQVYRAVDALAKAANSGAPPVLISAQADIVRRWAEQLIELCNHADRGERVHVDTVIPEGIQAIHSEIFGGHKEGTLPDTIPDEWKEDQ